MNATRKRFLAGILAAFALSAMLVIVPGQSASAADLISVVGSTTRAIPAGGAGSVSFPITFVVDDTLEVSVSSVTFKPEGRTEESRSEAAIDPSIDTSAARLTLKVDDAKEFTIAGDYEVVLNIESAAGDIQTLPLTLTRQAAALSAGTTINVVDYVGPFVKLAEWDIFPDSRPTLAIPVGAGGEILELSAAQLDYDRGKVVLTVACDRTSVHFDRGTCQLDAGSRAVLADPVGPDGQLTLDYEFEELLLDSTARAVELRSPQLAAPITLNFSVSQRLSPLLIPIITLVGLLAGVLIRVLFTKAIAWSARGLRASNLRSRIDGLRRRSPLDGVLLAELDTISESVRGDVTSAHVGRQEKKLDEVVERVNKYWKDAGARYKLAADSLDGVWTLPAPVRLAFAQAKDALATESKDIADRVRDERSTAQDASKAALGSVLKSSLTWLADYQAGLMKLLDAVNGKAPELKTAIEAALASVDTTPSTAGGAVAAVHSCMSRWEDVLTAADEEVGSGEERERPLAATTYNALHEADPARASSSAATPLEQLLEQRAATPKAQRKSLEFVDFRGMTSVSDGDEDQRVALHATDPAVKKVERRRVVRFFYRVFGGLAKASRFVLLLLIACVFIYGANVTTWIGTFDQILAVFAIAFAFDITVDAVSTLVASKGKPTPVT